MRAEPGRVDRADVDDVRNLFLQLNGTRIGAVGVREFAAVGERNRAATFSTPIITVRSPSRISRCFSFQKKSFLTV